MKTVSLELSKQLKEAGYPQAERGVFYWFIDKKSFTVNKEWKLYYAQLRTDFTEWEDSEWCVSSTADEILDLLPEQPKGHKAILIGHYEHNWIIRYEQIGNELLGFQADSESLADAAAKMWLYLKKENLI